MGLIICLYINVLLSRERGEVGASMVYRFWYAINAFLIVWVMCGIKFALLSSTTPRYLRVGLTGMGVFLMDSGRKSAGLCFLVIRIDSHFWVFSVNFHFLHQGVIIAICFCISILAAGSCLACV